MAKRGYDVIAGKKNADQSIVETAADIASGGNAAMISSCKGFSKTGNFLLEMWNAAYDRALTNASDNYSAEVEKEKNK